MKITCTQNLFPIGTEELQIVSVRVWNAQELHLAHAGNPLHRHTLGSINRFRADSLV